MVNPTTYSQMERSADSVKPSKTAGMRWPRISVMRQRRMNSTFTWLALICLHQLLVQGAEGSVGQNIQYPQVRVLLMPVCKFSRIVAPTPSRFPQHKGLFLRSASFAGIVCIVPGELRANNFTFSTRDASGTVHIAFAELLFFTRALTGIVCIVPVQLWALFIL